MLLLHGSVLMERKTQLVKNLIYHPRVNKGRFQPQLIVTHLGRPIASSKCGTVQLSSMMWPEMSRDIRCTRRWTMAVRIFLVILNFEIRLLSWEMSRCLKEEGVSSVTIFQVISGHTRGTTHVLKWQHANCSQFITVFFLLLAQDDVTKEGFPKYGLLRSTHLCLRGAASQKRVGINGEELKQVVCAWKIKPGAETEQKSYF